MHCQRLGVEVVDGDWDHNTWLEAVKGLENEPERGRRCSVCFSVRLRATAKLAHDRGIARFTPLWPLAAGRILTKSMPQGKKRLNIMQMSNIGTKTGEKTACRIGAMPF